MATVQSQLLKLALIVASKTKEGRRIQGDAAGVAITGAADNGAGLIRITAANHGFQTDQKVHIKNVLGTVEANNTASNPYWLGTRITANTFDLQGSAFAVAFQASPSALAVESLIGSVDTSRFPRQRLLDIYNDARRVFIETAQMKLPPSQRSWLISGQLVVDSAFTFATGEATKPSGYLDINLLTDVNGLQINVLPVEMKQRYKDRESATNPIVFDHGTEFRSANGNTYIPDAATYILEYYGITEFTLAQVMAGTATETIHERFQRGLIEMAVAVATEQDEQGIRALAEKILMRKAA